MDNEYRESCYFCHMAWGECVCGFAELGEEPTETEIANVPGFEFHEFWITSPNVTECSRFYVDPTVYYAEVWDDVKRRFPQEAARVARISQESRP